MASRGRSETRTGGRAATTGVILGDYALSVGKPSSPLPEGWRWTPLTDVARLETGHTPSRKHPEYWGGDVPWIGTRDATANHGCTIYRTDQYTNELGIANSSARVLPENTVCLSRTASVGYVVVMGRPMATSQDFVNWVCSKSLDFRYLKYVLLAEQESFLRFASGTTHQTIYFPEVKAFHAAIPPINEQKRIADTLSALDDSIDLLCQTNATLEAIAQALFKSWFVDYDPVHAKADGREPEGMDAATAALFPREFAQSELGLIPKGWRRGLLGELCQNVRKQAKPDSLDPTTPYIGLEHMPRGSLALTEAGSASGLASGKFWYAKNDVLFGKLRPYFHKVGVASHTGVCSTDILVVRANEPDWFGFSAMQLSSEQIIAYATRLSNGAKMPRSSWSDIAAYKVVVPPEPVATAFDGIARAIIEGIHANIDQATNLASLRDTLLPRLISGKLRLPEAENAIEEVLA